DRLAVEEDLSLNTPDRAEEGPGQDLLPGSHEAEEPHDLMLVEGEADVEALAGEGEVPHLQEGPAPGAAPGREPAGQLPAHHAGDDLILGPLVHGAAAHLAAVPEHGDPVGQGEDLIQLVGYVDQGHPLGPQG